MDKEQAYKDWLGQRTSSGQGKDQLGRDLDRIWEGSANYGGDFQPDVDAAWRQFRTKHKFGQAPASRPGRVRSLYRRPLAAAVALFITLGIAYFYLSNGATPTAQMVEVTTAAGEQREVQLPDGSIILLNENSQINYPSTFAKNTRAISFSGEAFFSIERAEEWPFVIATEKVEVAVLGTSFNIRAYPNEGFTETEVSSGKVSFHPYDLSETLELKAQEFGSYQHRTHRMEHKTNTSLNRQAWRTHQLAFINASLGEVVRMLERYYHIRIEIDGAADQCPITGRWDRETLRDFGLFNEYFQQLYGVALRPGEAPNSYRMVGKCLSG